ncbi:hypothetical protein LVJ94_41365 [Pendulispora rubella]|uniref:Uncharacterized protein n=1 Tax=Pendulispora rubella TaxID=2741070 RepID=A0ABZ2L271_9BACT
MSDDALIAAGWPARLKKLDKLRATSPLSGVPTIPLRPTESVVSPKVTSRGTLIGMNAGKAHWLARVDASPGHRVLAFREDVTGYPSTFGELGDGFFSADVSSDGTLRKLDDALNVVAERRGISPDGGQQLFDPDGRGGLYMVTNSIAEVTVAHLGADLQDLAQPRTFRVPSGPDIHFFLRRIGHASDRHCIEFGCSQISRYQADACPSRYLLLDANLKPRSISHETPPSPPLPEASLPWTPQVIFVRAAAGVVLLVLLIGAGLRLRWQRIAHEIAFGAIEGEIVQDRGTEMAIRSTAGVFTLPRAHVRLRGFVRGAPLQGPCVLASRFSGSTEEGPYRGSALAFAPGAEIHIFPGGRASAREFVHTRIATMMTSATTFVVVLTTVVCLLCQLWDRY